MNTIKVVTHDGVFHADEVMACAILKTFSKATHVIERSRDQSVITSADIVVDVGGVYDPINGRFDHHQKGGAGTRENGVPFSSCGLIWKHFAQQGWWKYRVPQALWCKIMDTVDRELVQVIDAVDCGVEGFDKGISQAIVGFNPTWMDETPAADAAFHDAVAFASAILKNAVASATALVMAEEEVKKAIANAEDGIIVMEKFAPWQQYVTPDTGITLVVFPAIPSGWRVQTVAKELGKFGAIKDLPAEWAGLRDAELAEISGVPDAIFCHNGRFICGARTREGALAMARKAMEA